MGSSVQPWRCAYKNFISLEFLFNKFTVKKREVSFIEYLSDKSILDKTYVFEENNIVKAFMTIGNCRDEDKKEETFELHGIYVDPVFQKQKIGTQLVNFFFNDAITKEKEEIVLWIFEKNIESMEFYKKIGFIADGKSKMMEGFKEKAIRMCKIL
jgi:GNAT superfamily N-acetyltransferase